MNLNLSILNRNIFNKESLITNSLWSCSQYFFSPHFTKRNLAQLTWTKLEGAEATDFRIGSVTGCKIQDKIHIFSNKNHRMFDLATQTWEETGVKLISSKVRAFALSQEKILLLGKTRNKSQTQLLNLITHELTPEGEIPPISFSFFTSVMTDTDLYTLGSTDDDQNKKKGVRVARFNQETNDWEYLTPTGTPPLEVKNIIASCVDNKIYVFNQGLTIDVSIYDIEKNEWISSNIKGNVLGARKQTATTLGKRVIFFAGVSNDMMAIFRDKINSVTVFNTEHLCWEDSLVVSNVLPEPRIDHCSVALRDDRLIVIGGKKEWKAIDDVWHLNLEQVGEVEPTYLYKENE